MDAHDAAKLSHHKCDPNNLKVFDFIEKLKGKVRCGDKQGAAFKDERRDDPEITVKTRGYMKQFKSKLYYHRNKKFGNFPMDRGEFGPYLIRTELNGNYYAQQILRKDYSSESASTLMKQWQDRSGYLPYI